MGRKHTNGSSPSTSETPNQSTPRLGRPPIEIDYELLERLCNIQCTDEEIGAAMNISVDTIIRHKQFDEHFAEVYKRARENGRMSLRRVQFKKALDGNVVMMIWLGKQYLGQSDKQEVGEVGAFSSWADLARKAMAAKKPEIV